MKLYGPSYVDIGAVYTLEPLTRAPIILIRMTPPLWVASFVLYKNVNGISDKVSQEIEQACTKCRMAAARSPKK